MAPRDTQNHAFTHYEADEGQLTAAHFSQIRQRFPQGAKRHIASSLFDGRTQFGQGLPPTQGECER